MARLKPLFILAALRGAEAPLLHGVHQAYLQSDGAWGGVFSKVKNPTLSQKTRQGWGTPLGPFPAKIL